MANTPPPIPIGFFGSEETPTQESRGCSLWPVGYVGALTAAGGSPVFLDVPGEGRTWRELLEPVEGVIFTESRAANPRQVAEEEALCQYCREHSVPLLAIDQGMHVLNVTHGGSLYNNLPKEFPEALQHRHPPEKGLRHAINVTPRTRLAELYGEGEVVVNSEHRKAIQKVARGFCVSATALDGVIEAIEAESEAWFALGVQWRPASTSASGLDIQLFRGLIDACRARQVVPAATDSHAA